uniref:DUF6534 domain-containing protein n=1 Tax=Mycena chlorophos TaxID=658473 RepID=A0ABQ0LMU5_MYCCL|nr:predicted protein [Mycena chlorophos]
MAASITPAEVQAILSTSLAPLVVGGFVTVFALGIVTLQFVNFLQTFPNSRYFVKTFVTYLWVAQVAYTAGICQGTYAMAVQDFGNLEALAVTPVGLNVAQVIGGVIDHPIQLFFIFQIYRATRKVALSIFLVTCAVLLEVLALYICVNLLETHSISTTFGDEKSVYYKLLLLLFFGDGALDLVNAAVLCWHLQVQRQSAFSQRTLSLVNHLVVYTLQTGFTTSLVAFASAIAYAKAPNNYIWVIFFELLPGSFLGALLANLNNRGNLRFANGSSAPGPTQSTSFFGATGGVNSAVSGGLQVTVARNVMLSRDAKIPGEGDREIEMHKMAMGSSNIV